MELLYRADGGDGDDVDHVNDFRRKWLQDSCRSGLSCVSARNVLLFSTTSPHAATSATPARERFPGDDASSSPYSRFLHRVFVCDLNTPWDLHLVTSRSAEITTLCWDESGSYFAMADADGNIELWRSRDHLLSQWRCVAKDKMSKEVYLKAKFVNRGRMTFLNTEKHDRVNYSDKFMFRPAPRVAAQFCQKGLVACVFVSATCLATCLCFNPQDGSSQVSSKCLAGVRSRINHAAMTFTTDGKLVVATSSGVPTHPVRCFSIAPELTQEGEMKLDEIEDYPPVFIQSQPRPEMDGSNAPTDLVVGLCFVKEEDSDALLVATNHPSGGRVELWELKSRWQPTHKIFTNGQEEGSGGKTLSQHWQYVEAFTGPSPTVVSMATPPISLQSGSDAPCYVTAAFGDGSIQCLLRDSLQQVGSVEVRGQEDEDGAPSASKRLRPSSPANAARVKSLSFTATGNALVALDDRGHLHVYRMSPISDPGGPHTVPYLVTMLEYCLVSGRDLWDVTVCAKNSHVEDICDKLTENFEQQTASNKQFFGSRFMSAKLALYRLTSSTETAAADCMIRMLLRSTEGAFRTLLRTTDSSGSILEREKKVTFEKMSDLLKQNKGDSDVDNFVKMLSPSAQKEFQVEAAVLHSFKHLLQWTATLSLHLMAAVPEYKVRTGPGFALCQDAEELFNLRLLLLLVRLWGNSRDSCRPTFTRTAAESFDVVAKLFSLVTKQAAVAVDSSADVGNSFQDDCLRLPTQVMIPPLNVQIRSRGVAPLAVSSTAIGGILFEFGLEPDTEMTMAEAVFVEGAMANSQIMDCVKQMSVGKNPYSAKQCTRCHSMTLHQNGKAAATSHPVAKSWESRWIKHCPCGGNWKIKHFAA